MKSPITLRRSALAGLLALAALPALGALVSACAPSPGKSNDAAPCCAAQGQVEQPAPAFAGGATFEGLRIRPVIYETNACPSFSEPLESLLDMERAGESADVDPLTGTYSLRLSENALARKVAFVACANGCEDVVGVALLGAEVEPTEEGEYLLVAPIILNAPSGSFGTSTLELLADCELDARGIRGDLITADVRHVLTDLVTYPAVPSTVEVDALMGRLQDFDDGMQPALLATSGDEATFAAFRTGIEASVDECLGGVVTLGCDSASPIDAEFFRYYQLARLPFPVVPTPSPIATAAPGPLPPEDNLGPFVLMTWAQQLSDNLGPDAPLATDLLTESMLKQDAMFRHQLMEKAVFDAVAGTQFQTIDTGLPATLSLTFSSAGLPSIADSLDVIRTAIVSGTFSDPQTIYGPWQQAAIDIGRNMDVQLGSSNFTFSNLMGSAFGVGNQLQSTLDASATPQAAFEAVYSAGDGQNGAYQQVFFLVGEMIAGHSLQEQIALTDILYFAGVNSAPPVGSAGVQ